MKQTFPQRQGSVVKLALLVAVWMLSISALSPLAAASEDTAKNDRSVPEKVITRFTDVQESDYFAAAVSWAVERGVTNGSSATAFSPYNPCTRAQVVTFLWRAEGRPESSVLLSFRDVFASSYFYGAVRWAVGMGIVKGTSTTTFSPSRGCSYAHVLTFLWRRAGEPVVSQSGPLTAPYERHWAYNALRWAESEELLRETEQPFDPSASCPRADVVWYLFRQAMKEESRKAEAQEDEDADIYGADSGKGAGAAGNFLYQASTHEDFISRVSAITREYENQVSTIDGNDDYITGRLLVKSAQPLPSLSEYHVAAMVKDVDEHYVIQFRDSQEAQRCAEYLKTLPYVEYAEPDRITTAISQGMSAEGGASVH